MGKYYLLILVAVNFTFQVGLAQNECGTIHQNPGWPPFRTPPAVYPVLNTFVSIDSVRSITESSATVYYSFEAKKFIDSCYRLGVCKSQTNFYCVFMFNISSFNAETNEWTPISTQSFPISTQNPSGWINYTYNKDTLAKYSTGVVGYFVPDVTQNAYTPYFNSKNISTYGSLYKNRCVVPNLTPGKQYQVSNLAVYVYPMNYVPNYPGMTMTMSFRAQWLNSMPFTTGLNMLKFKKLVNSIWKQNTNAAIDIKSTKATIGAASTTTVVAAKQEEIFPYHIGKKVLFLSTSPNILNEVSATDYFNTHLQNKDYWFYTGNDTSLTAFGLTPLTTYYVLSAQLFNANVGNINLPGNANYLQLGNVVNFTTKKSAIGNNVLETLYIDVCPTVDQRTGQYIYTFNTLKASNPSTENQPYQFQWQTSSDKQTWITIDERNLALFTPLAIQSYSIPPPMYIRRIVFTQDEENTSNLTTVNFLPPTQPVFVSQIPSAKNTISLSASPSLLVYNYSIQWNKTNIANEKQTPIKSDNGTFVLENNLALDHTYFATLTINGRGCNTAVSPTIGISPPDGSGTLYPTIQIGLSTWMMSNLKTTRYSNNTPIVNPLNSNEKWYSWYNNDSASHAIPYGALYAKDVLSENPIVNSNNVCPVGWHVANTMEWSALALNIGLDSAGIKMKTNTTWTPYTNGINAYNFNAMPAGIENGMLNTYSGKSQLAAWLVQCLKPNMYSYFYTDYDDSSINFLEFSNDTNTEFLKSKFSIRCVKND